MYRTKVTFISTKGYKEIVAIINTETKEDFDNHKAQMICRALEKAIAKRRISYKVLKDTYGYSKYTIEEYNKPPKYGYTIERCGG